MLCRHVQNGRFALLSFNTHIHGVRGTLEGTFATLDDATEWATYLAGKLAYGREFEVFDTKGLEKVWFYRRAMTYEEGLTSEQAEERKEEPVIESHGMVEGGRYVLLSNDLDDLRTGIETFEGSFSTESAAHRFASISAVGRPSTTLYELIDTRTRCVSWNYQRDITQDDRDAYDAKMKAAGFIMHGAVQIQSADIWGIKTDDEDRGPKLVEPITAEQYARAAQDFDDHPDPKPSKGYGLLAVLVISLVVIYGTAWFLSMPS